MELNYKILSTEDQDWKYALALARYCKIQFMYIFT